MGGVCGRGVTPPKSDFEKKDGQSAAESDTLLGNGNEGGNDQSGEEKPKGNPCIGCVSCCCYIIGFFLVQAVWRYFATNMSCDPKAPPSAFGWEALPRNITLDETASGAWDNIYGHPVDVFQGTVRHVLPGVQKLGTFRKVWTWWGDQYGYVEFTPTGQYLRFTVHQTWPLFHSPHVFELCQKGTVYKVKRPSWLDDKTHDIYEMQGSKENKIGYAKHQAQGVTGGASFFARFATNVQWAIYFHSLPKDTIVGMAYQGSFNGGSNWGVTSKAGPIPTSVPIATTAAASTGATATTTAPALSPTTIAALATTPAGATTIAATPAATTAAALATTPASATTAPTPNATTAAAPARLLQLNASTTIASTASGLPAGVNALPAHVIAFTSALYDLQTGSDRRRRSDGRRRR